MFAKNIEKEDLDKLPLIAFNGKIVEIDSATELKKAVNYLSKQTLLGFDTETKPCFKKGGKNNIAILQLATEDYAFLIKLKKFILPPSFIKILEDEKIIKVGVALKDDLNGLKKYSPFIPGGFIELQHYVRNFGIEDAGLKKLSGIVLGFKISKSQQVTNWEAQLTDAQKIYAATDAWVCLKIFKKLENSKLY